MMETDPPASSSPGVLTDIPRFSAPEYQPQAPLGAIRIPRINAILFFLTLLTTTMAGGLMSGEDYSLFHPIHSIAALRSGLSFSIPLMAILLSHEMGHYLTSRFHRVDATLPYFIPAPPWIMLTGTFGAFIRQRSRSRSRSVMFDIGAAGPWAGVMLAIPVTLVGLWLSDVAPLDKSAGGLELGNSIAFWAMTRVTQGVDPSTVNVNLHPAAFAGWIGLFITTLNLLPVGQLDGGHVVYALFPRWHRRISAAFIVSCVLMVVVPLALGYSFWAGWLLWGVLVLTLGLGHPAAEDADTPLDRRRWLQAWATVVLFALTFSPVPISFSPPTAPVEPSQHHLQEILAHPAIRTPADRLNAVRTHI